MSWWAENGWWVRLIGMCLFLIAVAHWADRTGRPR